MMRPQVAPTIQLGSIIGGIITVIAAVGIIIAISFYMQGVRGHLDASNSLQEKNRTAIDDLVKEFSDFRAKSEFAGRSVAKDVDQLKRELDGIKESLADKADR